LTERPILLGILLPKTPAMADELTTTFRRFVQLLNADVPILVDNVNDAGKVIDVKLEQFWNAVIPMLVIDVDIISVVILAPLNALTLIDVTEFGIVTVVAPQPWKALSGMFVNAFESVIDVKLVQF
jgi:hypothetical protein